METAVQPLYRLFAVAGCSQEMVLLDGTDIYIVLGDVPRRVELPAMHKPVGWYGAFSYDVGVFLIRRVGDRSSRWNGKLLIELDPRNYKITRLANGKGYEPIRERVSR